MSDENRCYRCDQPRSTHDDGFCEATRRSMILPATPKKKKEEPKGALEAFKKEGEPNHGV